MYCLVACLESCSEFFQRCADCLRTELDALEYMPPPSPVSSEDSDDEIMVVVEGDTDSDGFQPIGARIRRVNNMV